MIWRQLFLAFLFPLVGATTASADSAWLDRSYSIFFPPSMKENVTVSQVFPIFWWNFVVLDMKRDAQGWNEARELCKLLKSMPRDVLLRVECNQGLQELESLAADWARDLPLRVARPDVRDLKEKLDSALAKASLPMGDRALIGLLRADPLESWQDLRHMLESRMNIKLVRAQGFFYDAQTSRAVIPIQAAFAPTDTPRTRVLMDVLGLFAGRASLIGSHGSTLRNEEQVMQDLDAVALASYVILGLIGFFFFVTRRWRMLLLFPPVFVAVGFGAGVTFLIFGSIHGLTLSLGAGIIGLALDYGFNGALAGGQGAEERTWRSNRLGLTTTLTGLVVLMTSSIPLLRQMMVFSASGLLMGYLIFSFLLRRYPQHFLSRPTAARFAPHPIKTAIVAILVLGSVGGLFVLRPNLDMKQFDFQDARSKPVADWLFKLLELRPPLFTVNADPGALENAHREKEWATGAGIDVENIANYLPTAEKQVESLKTWAPGTQPGCTVAKGIQPVQRKLFSGFVDDVLCMPASSRASRSSGDALIRSYTAHLHSGDRWLTLWAPKTEEQEKKVLESRPGAHSLRELVMQFPRTLGSELGWMVPLSVALVVLIHLVYYRSVPLMLITLVPFMSGLGLFTLVATLFGLQVSFISVIALVMCFGFSFDYAVFSVDYHLAPLEERGKGVWEAITSAACATLAGFLPLLFCRHPVLSHLGQALCISTTGCYLGAVWGVPGLLEQRRIT